jgi:hypothetical protein
MGATDVWSTASTWSTVSTWPPLHQAVTGGHVEVVEHLLASAASMSAMLLEGDTQGRTPLMLVTLMLENVSCISALCLHSILIIRDAETTFG